jgi:nucleoside-diphosphate-sugar epimerase
VVANFIRAALAGRAPQLEGEELDERDYVHVSDAAAATMTALRAKAEGIFNVATGIGTTTVEVANLIVWLTGGAPAPVLRPGHDPDRRRTGLVLDVDRARAELGFTPQHSLPEGLTEEIGWFRTQLRSNLRAA